MARTTDIDAAAIIERLRSKLALMEADERHLLAVKILNRWARNGRTWYSGQVEVIGPQGEYRVVISDEPTDFSKFYYADTPEAAQIAAAAALANEDPSLLEGLE